MHLFHPRLSLSLLGECPASNEPCHGQLIRNPMLGTERYRRLCQFVGFEGFPAQLTNSGRPVYSLSLTCRVFQLFSEGARLVIHAEGLVRIAKNPQRPGQNLQDDTAGFCPHKKSWERNG